MNFGEWVRDIPDFPIKGILFKDLTTLWKDAKAFRASIAVFVERYKDKKIDKIVGAESRGFIIGAPLAYCLGAGFVPVRKKGKLPAETLSKSYALEYGEATIEIHKDAVEKDEQVLIVDDLLATGGTTAAMIDLINQLGGNIVECAFWIELDFLNGRKALSKPVFSLLHY